MGRCTVSPDRKAFKCWRDGGQVHQTGKANHGHTVSTGSGKTYPTLIQAIEAVEQAAGGRRAADWTYRNRDSNEVLKVVRLAVGNDKEYRPVHRSKDRWKIGDPPGKLPLYRLNELPTDRPIYVCEGEKAADMAASIGLAATTSAHGSSSAGKTDWTPLAGRDAVVLPDNDEPGRKYADDVTRLLMALDPPATVRVVGLPGLPIGGDIVEYIEAGGTRKAIGALADAMERVNPADVVGGPVLTCLADVKPQQVQWLWPERIALGKLNLLFGDPGLGKSFLTLDWAARVSTGRPWPDGSGNAPLGSTILLNCEDDLADTIRPRLDAAGANVKRIIALEAVQRPGNGGKMIERSFTLDDLPMLADAVKRTPGVKLLVIDPVSAYMGNSDSHKNAEIRGLLAPLSKLASDYRLAVVLVTHMNKGGGRAMYRAMGSLAFIAAARSAWAVAKDEDDSKRRLFLPAKNNIGNDETGLSYSIIDGAVAWDPDPVTQKLDDVLSIECGGETPGPDPEKPGAAAEWLRERLKDGPTYVGNEKDPDIGTIRADVKAAGMGWMTVRRAMEQLGVISERCTYAGKYQWRLPKVVVQEVAHDPLSTNNLNNLNNQYISIEKDVVFPRGDSGCSGCESVNNQGRERGEI
jgi:hypothetical protein